MRFSLLGPVVVEDAGRQVAVGGPKAQQVLACLLVASPHPVSVDALVDDLWEDRPPATAAHVVSTYVSGLRAVLGGRIRSGGPTHALCLDDGDTLDTRVLAAAVTDARTMLPRAPGAALDRLDPVGPALSVPPLSGLADRSALLRAEAERLSGLQALGLRLRAEARLALGRAEEAEAELAPACRLHPYDEQLHALRMLALYRAQRQADALEVFRELHQRLATELGIEPGPRLRELRDAILVQDPRLSLTPPHRLPRMPQRVGREHELAELVHSLPAHRMLTLHGPGGIGKSTLAAAAARELVPHYPGGTWWVDLAPVRSPGLLMDRVRSALDVPPSPGLDATTAVASYLRQRPALLVLDGCEHLLPDAGDVVADLLDRAPDLTVLTTSRIPLLVPDERVLPVGPLTVGEAHALFLARAGDAAATQIDPEAVDALCASVDRIPLAIEIAAARAGAGSAPDSPGKPDGTGSDRHATTMAATIAWSHGLLDPQARAIFDALAVFRDDITPVAATAVCGGDPEDPDQVRRTAQALARLADSSMLAAVPDGSTRYRMLQPLRSFGRGRLVERGVAERVFARHARYHLDLLERAGEDRLTPAFAGWVARIQQVEGDLSAALDWALDRLDAEAAAAAAPALFEYWFRRGDPPSAYAFGSRLLARGARLPVEHETAARLCVAMGAAFTGEVDAATTRLDSMIDAMADSEDWRGLVWAALGRGQNATVFGDFPTIEAMGRTVLAVCRAHGERLSEAYGHALLGEAEFLRGGDLDRARRHTETAIEGFRQLQDPASLNLFGLGIAAAICVLQGDLDRAEEYATEAATLPGPGWRATALIILGGWVVSARGDTTRADLLIRRGTEQAIALSLQPWVRHGFLMLARVAAARGQPERAAFLFGAATPQPPWGQDPRWWAAQAEVRATVGPQRYDDLAGAGARAPAGDVVALAGRLATHPGG